jgi:hypothetical protein
MPEERDDVEIGGEPVNYVKEALKWQYNWIGLAGAAAFAVVSGSGLPIVLAAGLELMYVALVPQSSRFRRLVRSWKFADEKRKHDERMRVLTNELTPEIKQRIRDLERVCESIRANYQRLSSSSQVFVGQIERQLQGLLTSYVRLSHAAIQNRDYVQLNNAELIRREIEQLQRDLPKQAPKVQEINTKRVEILTKRLEKFGRIRENRQVVDAQCRAIEDMLQLIRDQSMTMSDPQQISDRLGTLVQDVEQTEEMVREVEAIFQMTPEAESSPMAETQAIRNRIRS